MRALAIGFAAAAALILIGGAYLFLIPLILIPLAAPFTLRHARRYFSAASSSTLPRRPG